MNNETSIILIGYRATGKSSVGRCLSERLYLPFEDTDILVEQRYGKTIREMFSEEGEAVFREREAALVAELSDSGKAMILSTGGGVPLRADSRLALRKMGFVVWLQASRETIYQRMNGDETSAERRPPLTDLGPLEEIDRVLAARHEFYRQTADLALSTDDRSVQELANDIIRHLS